MEIKLIKLTNGQDLVVEVIKQDEDSNLTIKNALYCAIMPNDQTAIMSWCPFCPENTELDILERDIMFVAEPIKALKDKYNEMFGSGIIVSPSIPQGIPPEMQGLKLHVED